MKEDYTTLWIKKVVKASIERIAAEQKIKTGKTMTAGDVVEEMVKFWDSLMQQEQAAES